MFPTRPLCVQHIMFIYVYTCIYYIHWKAWKSKVKHFQSPSTPKSFASPKWLTSGLQRLSWIFWPLLCVEARIVEAATFWCALNVWLCDEWNGVFPSLFGLWQGCEMTGSWQSLVSGFLHKLLQHIVTSASCVWVTLAYHAGVATLVGVKRVVKRAMLMNIYHLKDSLVLQVS